MYLSARIFRPLRSKRAMISPVRPRANASGLTRMRVRSMWGEPSVGLLWRRLVGRRRLGFELLARAPPAPAARWRGRHARDLSLAVRADPPCGIERLAAVHAWVLELAHAVRAAQEVLLHLVVAMRAEDVIERVQARLGGLHLKVALADVLEVLRWSHDHVHDRADEREERRRCRAADQHGIGDASPRVGVRVIDERQPYDDEDEDQQLDGRVQRVVGDAEDGDG